MASHGETTLPADLWRLTGRWYATLLVIALLYANNRFYFVEDTTGNWPAGAPVGAFGQPLTPEAWAVWRGGQVICLDANQVKESDRIIGYLTYTFRDRTTAMGAAGNLWEQVQNNTSGGAPADPKLVEAAFYTWLSAHPNKYWRNTAQRLQGSAGPGSSLRWRAFTRVFLNLLLAALFFRSLAWTIPLFDAMGRGLARTTLTPAERAAIRRKKLLAAGKCPACEYDIRGLPARLCPECAHRWSEAEARTVPQRAG